MDKVIIHTESLRSCRSPEALRRHDDELSYGIPDGVLDRKKNSGKKNEGNLNKMWTLVNVLY